MKHSLRLFHLLLLFTMSIACEVNAQKVGVGTTTPSDALHIRSAVDDDALRVQVGTATKFRVLNNGGSTIGTNNVSGTPANGLYVHGNAGIGISFPSDKLAVNGDINFTGQLKTDGNAGQQGQILSADGAGGMEWTDAHRFQNFRDFFNPAATYNWTVPAGVTEILVELWGAGGGGGTGGGGGAGGFVQALISVTPGEIYTFNLGVGGNGESTSGTAAVGGGATNVTGPGVTLLQASGGAAASTTQPGLGGSANISTGFRAIRRRGEHGRSNHVSFNQYSSTQFAEVIHYGPGGSSSNGGTGGAGDTDATNTVTSASVYSANGRPGTQPGGGGGGGTSNKGGDGFAIVRW